MLGAEHPHTLTTVNSLGTLYYAQGRYAGGGHFYRPALGKGDPNTVAAMRNLAAVYEAQGRSEEAGALNRRIRSR